MSNEIALHNMLWHRLEMAGLYVRKSPYKSAVRIESKQFLDSAAKISEWKPKCWTWYELPSATSFIFIIAGPESNCRVTW